VTTLIYKTYSTNSIIRPTPQTERQGLDIEREEATVLLGLIKSDVQALIHSIGERFRPACQGEVYKPRSI